MSKIITAARSRKSLKKPRHEDSWSALDKFELRRHIEWRMPGTLLLPLFPYCVKEEIRVGSYWY